MGCLPGLKFPESQFNITTAMSSQVLYEVLKLIDKIGKKEIGSG